MNRSTLLIPALTTIALLTAGCEPGHGDRSVRDELTSPSLRPKPLTEATGSQNLQSGSGGDSIATVNGRTIARQELISMLLESHGLGMLQQLMLRDAATLEAARLGFAVTPQDVEDEYRLTLEADHLNGQDKTALTPARKEQLIADWTRTRGVSRRELDVAMQRQAALRKIAASRLNITDEMLRAEFERLHGEKAEVRHLQLAAPRFWPDIQDRLARGERFEELVAQFSQNNLSRQKMGLLPAFSRKDSNIPPIFVDIAFRLRPGEHSNLIEAEGSFHVLKLERLIPAAEVSFESQKDSVRGVLSARLLIADMEIIARTMMDQANISIEDPVLREQYERARSTGRISGPVLTPAAR